MLELGCGLGLLGACLHRIGAGPVTLTDGDPRTVRACFENLGLNALPVAMAAGVDGDRGERIRSGSSRTPLPLSCMPFNQRSEAALMCHADEVRSRVLLAFAGLPRTEAGSQDSLADPFNFCSTFQIKMLPACSVLQSPSFPEPGEILCGCMMWDADDEASDAGFRLMKPDVIVGADLLYDPCEWRG